MYVRIRIRIRIRIRFFFFCISVLFFHYVFSSSPPPPSGARCIHFSSFLRYTRRASPIIHLICMSKKGKEKKRGNMYHY